MKTSIESGFGKDAEKRDPTKPSRQTIPVIQVEMILGRKQFLQSLLEPSAQALWFSCAWLLDLFVCGMFSIEPLEAGSRDHINDWVARLVTQPCYII